MDTIKKIIVLKTKLNELTYEDDVNLCGEELVKLSQELDTLLNIYYKEIDE